MVPPSRTPSQPSMRAPSRTLSQASLAGVEMTPKRSSFVEVFLKYLIIFIIIIIINIYLKGSINLRMHFLIHSKLIFIL